MLCRPLDERTQRLAGQVRTYLRAVPPGCSHPRWDATPTSCSAGSKALQHVRATGEVTPSGWQPGHKTLKPGPELVGKIWKEWEP